MDPIAIIGMSCRFPGSPSIRTFWELLVHGGDAITEVPSDRYDVTKYYDERPATPGKIMSRSGGFLDQVSEFDAAFFGISPREAAKIDPQHRLLMEVAWEALEDAGLVPSAMTEQEKLDIACFMGIITSDYWDRQFRNAADLDVYATTGSARSGAAGRLSFALDIMGASFAIDAACSSSLVAVDQAVHTLRSGAYTTAIAGGVNIILNPDHTIGFSQGKMMAADGHCKTFDAAADGYVRSEGAGVVVLKLLSRAQADGDRVYAVIRGSASNNDGHCDSFMAPSTRGQQAGLRKACRNASIDPLSIDYVEAHGPGTKAGDPIEITTLGEVLCQQRPATHPLLVGSVKTNIGHTEGAAGVAGLIKAVLSLKHGVIPPNLHFHVPSPAIPWQNYALKIPTELVPWPRGVTPRRAVVCSYGIAGTNTYIVLEEAPPQSEARKCEMRSTSSLLPLSARAPEALKELARRYGEFLAEEESAVSLSDLCYTSSVRRTHHDYRLAVVCHSREDAYNKLQAYLQSQTSLEVVSGHIMSDRPGKMVWIFPGQGSQWLGMGRDLLGQEPVFRDTIERCEYFIRQYAGWSLLEQLQADEKHSRLREMNVVQPMLFAIEIALAALWISWGIVPDAVIGHSMGEVAAACVAGALSLDDALWIICKRSELLLRASGKGAMAAVELTLNQANELVTYYKGRVSVAVSNSPNSTVLAGEPDALNEILSHLDRHKIFGRLVKVDVASHSPQMDPLRDDLLKLMQRVRPRQSRVPIYSTVNGNIVNGSKLIPQYWMDNLRQPVLFYSTTQRLLESGFSLFLEMSPHPILIGAVRQTMEASDRAGLTLASMQRNEASRTTMLAALGKLYVSGYPLNWNCLYPIKGENVSLPSYPWQRQHHWNSKIDNRQPGVPLLRQRNGSLLHPLLGSGTSSALHPPRTMFWTTDLTPDFFPYFNDHCIYGIPVLPCAAYIELSLAAATEVFGAYQFEIEQLELQRALFFPKGITQTFQVVLMPEDDYITLRFFSIQAGHKHQDASWTQHASARIRRLPEPLPRKRGKLAAFDQEPINALEYYSGLRARGIQHGPLFQGITHVWRYPGEVQARISVPEGARDDMQGYQIHPALMDAFLQAITPFLPEENPEDTYVPVSVKHIHFYQRPEPDAPLWTYATVQPQEINERGILEGDVALLDSQGHILIEVQGFRLQSLNDNGTQDFLRQRLNQLLYVLEWEQQSRNLSHESDHIRKHWLIFSDREGLGTQLAALLEAKGSQCTLVMPGAAYQRVSERCYRVSPMAPGEFYQVLNAWDAKHSARSAGIVYLWGQHTTLPVTEQSTLQMVHTDRDLTSIGVLHLLQALAASGYTTAPRLWLVTVGVHALEEEDRITALSQSSLWGLGRVIVYEHPDLHCTLIDLSPTSLERSASSLFQEIWSDDEEDEVALRDRGRYVARLAHSPFPGERAQTEPLFRADSTYLITGGLGGVGLRTAQWMVEQGAQHLVLLGRRGVTQEAVAPLQAMREAGATVHAMEVDIAQKAQLASALAMIRRKMPPLRGVFHSAVVLDDGTLLQLSRERFLSVMRPKVDGAWNLHQMTLNDPLDYFVLFSSAASLIGSPGQGNYAAANAFLDILSSYRRQQGYPALCINWGRWGEVGQATRENRGERLDARGFSSIKPHEGLAILGSLLRQSPPQVAAMSFHLLRWSQFYPKLSRSSLFARLLNEVVSTEEAGGPRLTREMLTRLNSKERRQELTQYLTSQIARVLGHASLKLAPHEQLNRLGIDSLMGVELKNRIGSDLNVVIPAITFLQGITLAQLTSQIEAQILGVTGEALVN